jgi:serine phosphatase RsbU (regulator of sigma subunit)
LPPIRSILACTILPPGSTLLIFSDSVTEAMDSNNRAFGEGRQSEYLSSLMDRSTQQICDALYLVVLSHTHAQAQQDDNTLVCLKRAYSD